MIEKAQYYCTAMFEELSLAKLISVLARKDNDCAGC